MKRNIALLALCLSVASSLFAQKKEDERFNKEFDKATQKAAELARDPEKQRKEEAKASKHQGQC